MNEAKKYCVDCKTTRTPLWRSGPHGPRSLCNACGIRHRKRKMAENNLSSEIKSENPSSSRTDEYDDQMKESLKIRYGYNDFGRESFAQRSSTSSSSSSSQFKKQRSSSSTSSSSITSGMNRKLGEVEQAAVLLMSLSCGSVFA